MTRKYKKTFKRWLTNFEELDFEEALFFFEEKDIQINFEKKEDYYAWDLPQHDYSIYAIGRSRVELVAKKAAIKAAIYFFSKTID